MSDSKDILKTKIEQRAQEHGQISSSDTGGVRLMWIEGPFARDRERLSDAFTDEQRKYRAKYLKSLELHPNEPVHVPEYERELLNPIRRFYMQPMSWFERNVIQRYITPDRHKSAVVRVVISRGFMAWALLAGIFYHLKYNRQTWEVDYGPRVRFSAPTIVPGDPRYPFKDPKTSPSDFEEYGFKSRKVFTDINKIDLIAK